MGERHRKGGRPILRPGKEPTAGPRTCPAVTGATNWPSPAFRPDTGLFYLMADESCGIHTKSVCGASRANRSTAGHAAFAGRCQREIPFAPSTDVHTGKVAWEIQWTLGRDLIERPFEYRWWVGVLR